MPGRLLLVPAPLDFGCAQQTPIADVLPQRTLREASTTMHWICENAKTARAVLKRIGEVHPLAAPLQQQTITELPREVHKRGDHDGRFDARPLLQAAMDGHDVGLLSEAGMPAVADPGASVVRAAQQLGIEVVPLVGPVSLLLALAASGLNGQNFAFVGYVPQDPAARAKRLRELESRARAESQTQILIETPFRNLALWQAMLQTLQANTQVAVASGITLAGASHRTRSVQQWKALPPPVGNDVPAVFAIGV